MEAAFSLSAPGRRRSSHIDSPEIASMTQCPVVTFSHLRWNSVFQRPHHIMTRLAEHRDVLFVEEPVLNGAIAGLEVTRVAPRIRVIQTHLPIDGPGFGPRQQRFLLAHLQRFLDRERWSEFVAWIYTPMAAPIARELNPRAIVYDCMDELSQSLNAPPELAERERELFQYADTVFTGGRGLYRAKRRLHHDVHCFPSNTSWDGTVERMDAILRRVTSDVPLEGSQPAPVAVASAEWVA
jgi:UDP-galactopyranose mutase